MQIAAAESRISNNSTRCVRIRVRDRGKFSDWLADVFNHFFFIKRILRELVHHLFYFCKRKLNISYNQIRHARDNRIAVGRE